MKSLGIRLAVVISSILTCLVLIVGFWLERQLTSVIHQQGVEQAEVHAKTILGSLKTLMLNGNGPLAREWLDRLDGVAGIDNVEVVRRNGQPAFTDLSTVNAVNNFLGHNRFTRATQITPPSFKPISPELLNTVLSGNIAFDLTDPTHITVAMPIQADVECLTCHGYDESNLRGVLQLSLLNESTQLRIEAMRSWLLSGSALLVLTLGLALWGSIRQDVLRPIAALRDAIKRVGKGDRATQLPVLRKDELGELAEAFNQMQSELLASEIRIRAVMDNVLDAIIIMTDKGIIEHVNPAVQKIFGYPPNELIGENVTKLAPSSKEGRAESILGDQDSGFRDRVLGVAREILGRRNSGSRFPMDVAISEMKLANQQYFIAIIRDITSRKAQTAALRYQALHDSLTDLPNRLLLFDRIQQALRSAQRSDHSMSLILMDLDRFKEVNDTLGHHVGDKLLQQVAQKLRLVLRESDTVARLGGDEFAVVLPEADMNQAIFTARKIINTVERPLLVEGQNLSVGVSLGIALFPQHGGNSVVLLQRADVAMYIAKRSRCGYAIYDPDQDQHSVRQLSIAGELRQAIENNELILHYQPKIDLKTRQLNGLEALVRWQHPTHGLLPPDEFIPLAEQTGLIRPLTTWVLKNVLSDYEKYHFDRSNIRVAINLSVRNLADQDFADEVSKIIKSQLIPSSALKFEITETALMEDPMKAIDALDQFNTMGFRLSIDDFGTGYSSLAYLKRLPVHELKIDKAFCLSLISDRNSVVIVRSTIDLAHKLGLGVVAEGVESGEALDLLATLGCDTAQGFYVCRPMPINQMKHWLENKKAQPLGHVVQETVV